LESLHSCDSLWDSLSGYADGLASPSERARVEGHVAQCETCARDLEFMRRTSTALSDVPEVAPPAGLRDAILAATVNKRVWYQRFGWGGSRAAFGFNQHAYAGAAAAAGVILAFVVVGRSKSNAPEIISPGRNDVVSVAPVQPETKQPSTSKSKPITNNERAMAYVTPSTNSQTARHTTTAVSGPSAMQTVDRDYHLPVPAVVVRSTSPVLRKIASSNHPMPVDPGHKKTIKEPANGPENLGPMMETAVMMTPVMMDPDMGPMVNKTGTGTGNGNAAGSVAAETSHREYRIQLTNSDEQVNPGAVASLADLRNALKKSQTWQPPSFPLVRSNERKEVRVDLLKGKF
jgi:hypothetical protein